MSHPLATYTSCEISDALSKLGFKNGGYIPDITMYSPLINAKPPTICGPAYTVKMVPATDKVSPTPSRHFVDAAEEGSVIVISAPPRESTSSEERDSVLMGIHRCLRS